MRTFRLISILGFIALGLTTRLLPHIPNFTAINAIALMGISVLGSSWASFAVLSFVMLCSDVFFGFHHSMPFVYLSYGLTVILGSYIKAHKSNAGLILLSSFIFFAITNFGVWWNGCLYSKDISGFALCYVAALPFLLNQVLADLIFGLSIQCIFGFYLSIDKKDKKLTS